MITIILVLLTLAVILLAALVFYLRRETLCRDNKISELLIRLIDKLNYEVKRRDDNRDYDLVKRR